MQRGRIFHMFLLITTIGLPSFETRSVVEEKEIDAELKLIEILIDELNSHMIRDERDFEYKYLYVATNGNTYTERPPSPDTFEIAAFLDVEDATMIRAADIIHKLFRNLGQHVVDELVGQEVRFGIFNDVTQKATHFPEFVYMRDTPECNGTCEGSDCGMTCDSLGRKYDSLPALENLRAVVAESNLICGDTDHYAGLYNAFVHEVAHTIHRRGINVADSGISKDIGQAFKKAKRIWSPETYAMTSELEYFAEGTEVYFHAGYLMQDIYSCGNDSGGCPDEAASRAYLALEDGDLSDVLEAVYGTSEGEITVCP